MSKPLLEKGLFALFLGIGLLAAPLFLGNSPTLQPIAHALKTPAWIAVGVGLLLLAAHDFAKRIQGRSFAPAPHVEPHADPGSIDGFPPETPAAPCELRSERGGATAARTSTGTLAAPATKQLEWSNQVFRDIEWRRFEAVCERLFSQGGFEARSQSHGADGGVDIWLYSKHSEGPAAVVQCKHWLGKPVGVKEVREFLGVITSKAIKRGTFATSSTFTPAAIEFAKENGINLLDGARLLELIGRRSAREQQELLAVAYEGDYWRPTCASCGVKMVERTAARSGNRFWGCTNFPKCRTTLGVRAA